MAASTKCAFINVHTNVCILLVECYALMASARVEVVMPVMFAGIPGAKMHIYIEIPCQLYD